MSKQNLRVRVNSNVIVQSFENELLVVNLETDGIYRLNATGKRMWELINIGYDTAQIQEQMLREYDVEEDKLSLEVTNTLARLVDQKLVTVSDAH